MQLFAMQKLSQNLFVSSFKSSSSSFSFNVHISPSRMGLVGQRLLSTCVDPAPHAPLLPSHTHFTFSQAFLQAVIPQRSPPYLTQHTPPALFTCPNHLSLLLCPLLLHINEYYQHLYFFFLFFFFIFFLKKIHKYIFLFLQTSLTIN